MNVHQHTNVDGTCTHDEPITQDCHPDCGAIAEPCIVCGAPVSNGIGHDAGCMADTTLTLEQLKSILSTYGVNDQERNAPVFVTIPGGSQAAITASEVHSGKWDEDSHTWVEPDSMFVVLTAVEVQR